MRQYPLYPVVSGVIRDLMVSKGIIYETLSKEDIERASNFDVAKALREALELRNKDLIA